MKKIGCVTFHAAHNYGSVLQAYALQEYIKQEFPDTIFEYINLRTEQQKSFYKYPFVKKSFKNILKEIFFGRKLKQKHDKFENFINNELSVTQEYAHENDIRQVYDIYLVGGDQVWNPRCKDFSWFYYFKGVENGIKVSYSPSMGANPILYESEEHKISDLIRSFDYIGVREEGTASVIEHLCTNKKVEILPDAALLLNKDSWLNLMNKYEKITIKEPYILFYDLKGVNSTYVYAKEIGKALHKKVIVTRPKKGWDIIGLYENHFETGPIDFLSLLNNADLIISTSFHGCVFSAIFHKPFIALDSIGDNRINAFLTEFCLFEHSIDSKTSTLEDVNSVSKKMDYSEFDKVLVQKKKIVYDFFSKILL